jgi:hypothetical protein
MNYRNLSVSWADTYRKPSGQLTNPASLKQILHLPKNSLGVNYGLESANYILIGKLFIRDTTTPPRPMDAYLLVACVVGAVVFAGLVCVWESAPQRRTAPDRVSSVLY